MAHIIIAYYIILDYSEVRSLIMNILFYLLPVVFCAAGVGCFVYGVKNRNKEKEARRSWVRTEGVVKSVESSWGISSSDEGSKIVYTPLYEYVVDSVSYETRGWASSENINAYNVGDRTTILYNPENPGKAMPEKTKTGFLFLLVGVLFFIAGIAFIAF